MNGNPFRVFVDTCIGIVSAIFMIIASFIAIVFTGFVCTLPITMPILIVSCAIKFLFFMN